MKTTIASLLLAMIVLMVVSCQSAQPTTSKPALTDKIWHENLQNLLPLLGHRNWILIVDKAYPAPSASNIEVINTGQDLITVAQQVDSLLKKQPHIRPLIFQDQELSHLNEQLVPGIDTFKKSLSEIYKESEVQIIPHSSVFERIDAASKLFKVVVLKTESVLPYTSLFIQLDCRYWNDSKESELRQRMQNK